MDGGGGAGDRSSLVVSASVVSSAHVVVTAIPTGSLHCAAGGRVLLKMLTSDAWTTWASHRTLREVGAIVWLKRRKIDGLLP